LASVAPSARCCAFGLGFIWVAGVIRDGSCVGGVEVFLTKLLPEPVDRVNDRGVVAAVVTGGNDLLEALSCRLVEA
jgi:hypothetical protein